jgi:L-galactose dehydrogenase
MERRPLGRTGLLVPALAFGTAPLGDIFGAIDEGDAIRAVHAALDHGVDYFDTAPLYGFGLAEERLGRALADRRDRALIATKCCRDGFTEFDFSAARVTASVDESLRRLGTDHIDVFQIHDVEFGDMRQVLEEAVPAAMALKETGKVRFVGITGLPVRHLRRLAAQCEIDTLLSWAHLNLVEDELVTELWPLAQERGFGLISASPLIQGLLTERALPDWHRSPAPLRAAIPAMAAACRDAGTDLASVAVRWAVEHPAPATTIVGIAGVEDLERNLRALDQPIPEGLLEALAALAAPVKNMMWFEGRPENNIPPSDPDQHVPTSPEHTHG